MLIVTRVDKEGRADGWWVYGPPGPKSDLQNDPANAFRFAGTITDESLRFSHPRKAAVSYRHRLTTDGRMDFFHTTPRAIPPMPSSFQYGHSSKPSVPPRESLRQLVDERWGSHVKP